MQKIHLLKITNYKSIDTLTLRDVNSFAVFAGANGCGKSNFFDALDFVQRFMHSGVFDALRTHGGFETIHSVKRRKENARKFSFEIDCTLSNDSGDLNKKLTRFHYKLDIHDLDYSPLIEENIKIDGKDFLKRPKGEPPRFINIENNINNESNKDIHFPKIYSALIMLLNLPLTEMLRNIRIYRIDPIGAKEPDQSDQDPSMLDRKGHNLASVLSRLELNTDIYEEMIDWMEMIVPSIERLKTVQQKLDKTTAIVFKERGTKKEFPAHLMSDGTVYALSLLVAILDAPPKYGLTMIEEPERGLHPKAIQEIIKLVREQAHKATPIWLSTHSESVVRGLQANELWLVDKIDGKTKMHAVSESNLNDSDFDLIGIDKAWLSNLLNGGLPW